MRAVCTAERLNNAFINNALVEVPDVSLSDVRMRILSSSTRMTLTLNIHGEHLEQLWVTPGHASLLRSPSRSLIPTPEASGTHWQQSHTEP